MAYITRVPPASFRRPASFPRLWRVPCRFWCLRCCTSFRFFLRSSLLGPMSRLPTLLEDEPVSLLLFDPPVVWTIRFGAGFVTVRAFVSDAIQMAILLGAATAIGASVWVLQAFADFFGGTPEAVQIAPGETFPLVPTMAFGTVALAATSIVSLRTSPIVVVRLLLP